MLKQLALSCLLGMASILYIAETDSWVKQHVLDLFIKEFERSLSCRMTCRLKQFSLLGSIELSHMQVVPRDGSDWSWHAQQFALAFSWQQFLLYGSLDLSIAVESPHIQSLLTDNELAMRDHLYFMFRGPQVGMYTFLKELSCTNMHCTITDPIKKTHFHLSCDSKAKKIDSILKSTIDVYSGSLNMQERTLFTQMSGSLQLDSFDGQPTVDLCLKGAASLEIPQLGSQMTPCYISGSWHHNRGLLSVKNINHSFALDPIMLHREGDRLAISIDAKVPLGYAWRMISNDNHDDRLSGNCLLQVKMDMDERVHKIQGNLVTQRMVWQDVQLGSLAKISFTKNDETVNGSVYIQRTSGACAGGDWSWVPRTGNAHMSIRNNARLTLSPKHDWQILPDDLAIEVDIEGKAATVAYDACATHAKVQTKITSKGSIALDEQVIKATGIFDANHYALQLQYQPEWHLEQCVYAKPDGKSLIDLKHQDNHYAGSITIACLKDLLKKKYNYDLQGEGTLEFKIDVGDQYQAHVHLKDGTIRLPKTFNFLNGFDCRIALDRSCSSCTVHDLVCQLHNGRLSSKKMQIQFQQDFTPSFVYAPLLIEKCLINMGKELFAVVSGNLLLNKRSDTGACLQGQLLIDRSQLKENLFSDVFQRDIRNYTAHSFETDDEELQCDIAIKTKYPVRIQTPFLETDARIDLHIKNTVRDPQVTGTIHLHTGKLHFPYKPLYITKGALHFLPGHADDPMIELSAKNIIKQHNISLQVTGSLLDQHVRLDSSPMLSEEQIIALLLVGSQEESLNMVMPALIMQNIKSILFGHDQSAANMSRYFNALFKPFGRIHLVPSFIDQSGRGGLRGAIEIDLSDRWRLVIQKNFSLTEDTRVELEYLLSDDVSVRATRDIRRDLIAEVEMRYKFGDS